MHTYKNAIPRNSHGDVPCRFEEYSKHSTMSEDPMQMLLKYQRELERLERENKELRKQMLLRGSQKFNQKKIKVTSLRHMHIDAPVPLSRVAQIDLAFAEISDRHVQRRLGRAQRLRQFLFHR